MADEDTTVETEALRQAIADGKVDSQDPADAKGATDGR